MEECGLPLLVPGEVTDDHVDIFDSEAIFIERHPAPLARAFPALYLEHITTIAAVGFVGAAPATVAATIAAHHLLLNCSDVRRRPAPASLLSTAAQV